jgi:uncharacterized protein with GYD domain
MSTYITLVSFTDQGIRSIRESPSRVDAVKSILKGFGGEFKAFYMTMGKHDAVWIYDAPDDAAAAKFTLRIGSRGNVRTTTMKAFPEAEYRQIIAALG